jgi:aspartate aminotransferase
MKFSKRIQKVQPSMTLSIEAKARELKERGEDVIGFGAGEPDFPTPENIKDAGIEAIRKNQTRYTPVAGTNEFKDAITAKFKRENGLVYQRNQIVVSCGAKQSFYNLAQVLWEEGDEIIVPAPYWVSYPEIILLSGAKPVIVNTTADCEFKVTPEQLKTAVTAKTRALVINSPSNPTGCAYTRKELEGLAEFALKHGLLIISDEIYERIVFEGFQPVSIASLSPEVQKNCVVINGVSKSYSMTGWRIGYLASEAAIADQVTKLQGQMTSNPTSISQSASIEALNGPQSAVEKMAAEFQKRRDVLVDKLRAMPGVTCYKPGGSFYAFPDFSGVYGKNAKGKTITGSLALADYLLTEEKVAIVPGIAFGADAHARLSFATSMENIVKGLDRIASALNNLK